MRVTSKMTRLRGRLNVAKTPTSLISSIMFLFEKICLKMFLFEKICLKKSFALSFVTQVRDAYYT